MTATPVAAGLPRLGGLQAGSVVALVAWVVLVALLQAAGAPRVWLLLVVAPVLEEAAFRAGLHEALLQRQWSALKANGATAVAFAALHVVVQGRWEAALVLVPALCMGLVYQRWRKVRWCVLLHAAMNGVWLATPLVFGAA